MIAWECVVELGQNWIHHEASTNISAFYVVDGLKDISAKPYDKEAVFRDGKGNRLERSIFASSLCGNDAWRRVPDITITSDRTKTLAGFLSPVAFFPSK